MGRGRAKAKQIKVARRLKYNSAPATDLTALERELRGAGRDDYTSPVPDDDEDELEDPYASYDEDDDDEGDDDYSSWAAGQR
ncbi:DUF3073 domain-containing protein [Ornithinimicrobium panacihumi]|uniref:DUF3073 domain-containing protein n=1 Tax=Ornithinimicrobium panacihumi TaxID=2008449 RepID=UPI003F8AE523